MEGGRDRGRLGSVCVCMRERENRGKRERMEKETD